MKVETPKGEIEVELADSAFKKALGLSFRKDGKMLFRFSRDTKTFIDMMLMRKPLHLYFMDSEREIIHVQRAEPWYRLPGKYLHRPEHKYRYLLESFEDLGLEEGDILDFQSA